MHKSLRTDPLARNVSPMNEKEINQETTLPTYLAGWKNEKQTLTEFRKLKPTLHKSTLNRMRQRKEIKAIKSAGTCFYKPETAFQIIDPSPLVIMPFPPADAA